MFEKIYPLAFRDISRSDMEHLGLVRSPPNWQTPAAVRCPPDWQTPAAVRSPPNWQTPAAVRSPPNWQTPAAVRCPPNWQTPAVRSPPNWQTPAAVRSPPNWQTPAAVRSPAVLTDAAERVARTPNSEHGPVSRLHLLLVPGHRHLQPRPASHRHGQTARKITILF